MTLSLSQCQAIYAGVLDMATKLMALTQKLIAIKNFNGNNVLNASFFNVRQSYCAR